MFNIQGFYKIKSIVNCSFHKEKIKTYLLSKSVRVQLFYRPRVLMELLLVKNLMLIVV